MPRYWKSALPFMLCLLWLSPSHAFQGKIIDVAEGDLVLVASEGRAQKIRLYGIACPVKGQPFHEKARVLMRFLAMGKNAEITEVYKDSDAVVNALLRIEGNKHFLNQQLIGYGLAWVKPPQECKARLCDEWRKHEGLAQENAVGLWAETPAIPPWLWKMAERMQIYEKSTESSKNRD
ncbi:MAG: thermonuclease family protein [Syntrophobacteraceae bacterium]